jgi:hypothetical protein
MRILSAATALAVVGTAVALSSCVIVAPCKVTQMSIEGTWAITAVNGQAIPSSGYPLPGSTDRLTIGTLYFERTNGQCDGSNLGSEEGRTVAEYTLVTAAGAAKPSQTYAGRFTHTVSSNTVFVDANGGSAFGTRSIESGEISFAGTLPKLGGVTVVFRRLQ